MKEAYRKLESIELLSGKKSTRTAWVETDIFTWTERQQELFEFVKLSIRNNAMHSLDYNRAFYLATDGSGKSVGGILF